MPWRNFEAGRVHVNPHRPGHGGETMNRDRIRDLAAGTSACAPPRFAYARQCRRSAEAAAPLGWPVVVKPVMSSSGKGPERGGGA